LGLEAPEQLLATGSATIADLKVTNTFSSEGLLSALDATISGTFKTLGDTFLANTTIAGDLTVDGTLSITGGNTIDVIGSPLANSPVGDGILYLQSNSLSKGLDILAGKFIFDKDGTLTVNGTVQAEQFKVKADTSAGSSMITKGQIYTIIENKYVDDNSIIIITPTSLTTQPLVIADKVKGGFLVKIKTPELSDVKFDYLIVGQGEKVSSN
jgi:hypothetical protein